MFVNSKLSQSFLISLKILIKAVEITKIVYFASWYIKERTVIGHFIKKY